MPEWMYYVNFGLNLLIVPLVKILMDIRNGLTKLEARFESHQMRLERLERIQDQK